MSDLEATKMSIGHRLLPGGSSRVPWLGRTVNEQMSASAFVKKSGCQMPANVHPTWAGTFVLAGMVALYPNIHFALIDNDCLPLTLFEITELWHLADPCVLPLVTKVTTIESASRDGEPPAEEGNTAPQAYSS